MNLESIIRQLPLVIHVRGHENLPQWSYSARYAWASHVLRHLYHFCDPTRVVLARGSSLRMWFDIVLYPTTHYDKLPDDGSEGGLLILDVPDRARHWRLLQEARQRRYCALVLTLPEHWPKEVLQEGDIVVHVDDYNYATVIGSERKHCRPQADNHLCLLPRCKWFGLSKPEQLAQLKQRRKHHWHLLFNVEHEGIKLQTPPIRGTADEIDKLEKKRKKEKRGERRCLPPFYTSQEGSARDIQ